MASAAERFTAVSTTTSSSAGKVEVIDDDDVDEESFAVDSEADKVKVDLLMPLIPGNGGSDDYESVFVLPKEDDIEKDKISSSKKNKDKIPKVTNTHKKNQYCSDR